MSLTRVPKRRRRGGREDAANSRLSKQEQDCGEREEGEQDCGEREEEEGEESAYEQLLASLGAGKRKQRRGERAGENEARQRRRGNRGSVWSTGQVDCQQPHRDQEMALGDPEEPNSDHEQPLCDHELNGRDGGSEAAAEASGGGEDRESGDSGDGEESGDEGTEERSSATKDPFREHFDPELLPEEVATLEAAATTSSPPSPPSLVPPLGLVSRRRGLTGREPELSFQSHPLTKLQVKQRLARNWKSGKTTTDLQKHLFAVMSSYTDLLYSQRTCENAEEVRRVYSLHALNHVLKTRSRVLKNNRRLLQAAKAGHPIEEPRDQGLTRPKVLILLPFRHSALQVVQTLTSLLTPPGQGHVHNHRRFLREFGEEKEVPGAAKVPKPSSYTAMFAGNTDDCFRVGVAVQGKVLRLFADFYSADIILASPLGLRTIIGAEGEKKRDFDFLSSVELLVLDQTDVFLMQNWEHVTHVLSHLHRTPSESHGVDFSRVRLWALNEWSHFYRQTLVFSSIQTPEINSLLTAHCHNYVGCVRCDEDGRGEGGSVGQVVRQLPQVFTRLSCPSHTQLPDTRLHHFTAQVLPGYHGDLMKGTLVFIPSYLDFVRLRNHMKKQELSFAAISEYTTGSVVSRARTEFYHSQKHFLLYTERAHFFHRYRLRGVRHVLFYFPPTYPEHYAELVNMVEGEGGTVEVLHSRWEQLALCRIVGGARANRISSSSDTTHMIITGN